MGWPLFDLRLSIGDVVLRPVSDADLQAIAAMFPDDDEQDPRWEHFAGLSAKRNRHRLLVQRTWHYRGSWSPSSWCLDLAVEVSGELVGLQALEADDFVKLPALARGSWLVARGPRARPRRHPGDAHREPGAGLRPRWRGRCDLLRARRQRAVDAR